MSKWVQQRKVNLITHHKTSWYLVGKISKVPTWGLVLYLKTGKGMGSQHMPWLK